MERNTAADSCGLALDFQSSLVQFVGIRYPNYVTINIVGLTLTMQNIRTGRLEFVHRNTDHNSCLPQPISRRLNPQSSSSNTSCPYLQYSRFLLLEMPPR